MNSCPLDYGFCCQTATVYHQEADRIVRKILYPVFHQWEDRSRSDRFGEVAGVRFLLVIPDTETEIVPGDRVVPGTGPEITSWPEILTFPGMSQVQTVRPCFWQGRLCHVEVE